MSTFFSKFSIRKRLFIVSLFPLIITCLSLLSIIYVQLNTLVKTETESATTLLTDAKKAELKNAIDIAYNTIKPLYESGAPREEGVKLLQRMRFSKEGYIFGYDSDSVRVFLGTGTTDGVGKSYKNLQDANGVYLVNELVRAGKENKLGSGDNFVTYHFPRPNEETAYPKLSYAIFLEKWDLMIGVGVYIDSIETEAQVFEKHVTEVSVKLITTIIVLSIALIILMIMLSVIIVKSILTPLSSVSDSIRLLSEGNGDLTKRVPVQDKFETGQLAENLNRLLSSLHGNISAVYKVSVDVDEETNLLVKQAENIKSVSTQQQSAIELVASASNEMVSSSNEVLSNAKSAADAAQSANSHGMTALDKVKKSSVEMSELIVEINKANDVVKGVGDDVQNISAILQVIESIAEQTNLLALNAAIEAARAGEQGRGFAVVADEVRNLASKTQGSTEEIQQMIVKLQNGSKSAVEAMQLSMSSSANAESSVSESLSALNDIAESVAVITDMNSQIASAAAEQNEVGEDIGKRIEDISTETFGLKEIAQQNNLTSETLSVKANELEKIVSQFKL
ncbi:cache domain-containing protein [Alteromonas sp. 5E99-2]|uniref:methyl-accepting chemotaxis protein n=1 Tax=Alteromonas sp. 5E99-2 TaxID=2817683 RepID=UPI001A9948E5|nr:methyl-accepting chemotaxis protein [Alteromonas sp. 5E99-2]MBO1255860.1 cache domain-containing protein [Alteromonas sp. 5E99-2]